MSDSEKISAIEFVNAGADPYPRLCQFLLHFLKDVRLSREDKQEVLAEVSDILDDLPPSKRSGLQG